MTGKEVLAKIDAGIRRERAAGRSNIKIVVGFSAMMAMIDDVRFMLGDNVTPDRLTKWSGCDVIFCPYYQDADVEVLSRSIG